MKVFKKGQSVKTRADMKDYETGKFEMGNWQGRVVDFHSDEEGTFVEVQWDSVTLQNMPDEYIEESINEDLDYENFVLDPNDLELCEPRDEEKDVHRVQAEVDSRYFDMDSED